MFSFGFRFVWMWVLGLEDRVWFLYDKIFIDGILKEFFKLLSFSNNFNVW